jgi:hypothetical protein
MYLGDEDGLNRLIEEAYGAAPVKTDFLDSVKGHPSVVTHCSAGSAFMEGYKDCLAKHRPELDVWTVKLLSSLGSEDVLVGDAEAVRAHVQGLLAQYRRPAKPTPAKVLTKMVTLRLEKVLEKAKAGQAQVDRDRKSLTEVRDQQEDAEQKRGFQVRIDELADWGIPDFSAATRQELVAWGRACSARAWEGKAVYQDLENVLLREDLDEESLRAACDTLVVKDVMAS